MARNESNNSSSLIFSFKIWFVSREPETSTLHDFKLNWINGEVWVLNIIENNGIRIKTKWQIKLFSSASEWDGWDGENRLVLNFQFHESQKYHEISFVHCYDTHWAQQRDIGKKYVTDRAMIAQRQRWCVGFIFTLSFFLEEKKTSWSTLEFLFFDNSFHTNN